MTRPALAPLVGAALAIAAIPACSPDFDPYTRLSSLRVLAVQSEPVAPAPGETTTLRAMVYTPAGDAVTEQHWSWCPFGGDSGDGAPCLVTEAELAELAEAAGADPSSIPRFDLGSGETAAMPHTIPTELLDALCTSQPGQPALVDCDGGFPIEIRLVVRTATAEVVTVRRLRLRRDGDQPNTNPSIDGLGIVGATGEQNITDGADVTVARDVETPLRARVSPEMIESYAGEDVEGNPATLRERLTLTWFVESGDTSAGRTGSIDGVIPLEDALEVDWTPATTDEYAPDTSRVIVVIRDNRDGASWRTATVRLGGAQ